MCNPFRVSHDPYVGNYLVASRDIAPLEVVLTDKPAVVAPQSKPLCLACLREVDTESGAMFKTECGVIMCGEEKCSGKMEKEGMSKGTTCEKMLS